MSRKIYNRLSFMAVSWLDESTLGVGVNSLCRTQEMSTMRKTDTNSLPR